MKIKYLLILVLFPAVFFTACQEEDLTESNPFLNEKLVYFERSNPTVVAETAVRSTTADDEAVTTDNQLFFQINRTGRDASSDLVIDLSTSVVFTTTTDFHNAGEDASGTVNLDFGNSVTIPAGAYSTKLGITAIDDLLSSGAKEVTVRITGVSDPSYSIGVPAFSKDDSTGVISEEEPTAGVIRILIEDDDCPIDIPGEWVGAYTLSEAFTAGVNDGVSFGFLTVAELTFDPSNPAGTSAFLGTDATSPAGEDFFIEDTPINFNTCPQTISFASPLLLDFTVNDNQATFRVSSATYNPNNFSMVFVGNLGNVAGSNFGEYTITLIKQ